MIKDIGEIAQKILTLTSRVCTEKTLIINLVVQ